MKAETIQQLLERACPEPNTGCWLWTLFSDRDGYGILRFLGRSSRRAHRVAWQLAQGPIPEGLWVLHKCDTPACINPGHLFLGDHAANEADKRAKGRVACGDRNGLRKHPERAAKGEANGKAKLTETKVREILRRLAAGEACPSIAARFGVSISGIQHIAHGRCWTQVAR